MIRDVIVKEQVPGLVPWTSTYFAAKLGVFW